MALALLAGKNTERVGFEENGCSKLAKQSVGDVKAGQLPHRKIRKRELNQQKQMTKPKIKRDSFEILRPASSIQRDILLVWQKDELNLIVVRLRRRILLACLLYDAMRRDEGNKLNKAAPKYHFTLLAV